MAESLPMNGGDGINSYSKNSQYQKGVHDLTKAITSATIMEKLAAFSTTFRIAELGCSVGPNTFFAMQSVIEAVQHKWPSQSMEFQVFFNDQTANDFNTLFASLPSDRQYYAAAAPGSFYGRIFPRASINVAHSSFALQWPSQLPKPVSDSKSPAWNEGRIHYTDGCPKATVDAYAEQFEKDMEAFLSARAEEIVPGGIMVLTMPGVPDENRPSRHYLGLVNFVDAILLEMMREGIVEKSEIDGFNLPMYYPSVEEMKKVINKDGCFNIESIELINHRSGLDGHTRVMHFKVGFESIFGQHFGRDATQKLFEKSLAKSEQLSNALYSEEPQVLIAALKRK